MALAEKALKVRSCFVGEGVNLTEGREQLQHFWLNSIELSALFVEKKYSLLDLFVKVKLRWGFAQKYRKISVLYELTYSSSITKRKGIRQKQKMENICLPNQFSGKVRGSVVVQGPAASRGRGLLGVTLPVCDAATQSKVLFAYFSTFSSYLFQIWRKRIRNMKIQP